jgi:pimeloyl-ACP methyl ester carboxylesterase
MPPTSVPIKPATLLTSTSHTLPNRLLVTELFFSVPLDHAQPSGRQLKLFCRTAERPPAALDDFTSQKDKQLPYIVYIPGGPGMGCPAPGDILGVTNFVLDKGYKLLCFDHRGMGMSTPVSARSLLKEGGVEAQMEYLKMFRATEAVKDLEALRMCLTAEYDGAEWRRKWSVMGQSYGGFVCTTYLSFYPEGLREVWVFGGLPPVMERGPDAVIKRLIEKVRERNESYYKKYPEDVERVKGIVGYLKSKEEEGKAVKLPTGGILSAGRFLEMGIMFGFHSGLDWVHDVVLRLFRDLSEEGEISRPGLATVDRMGGGFDDHVIYALLHEPVYCQGRAGDWAFDRVIDQESAFGVKDEKARYLFTGEMVFRRAFDDYHELTEVKDVAEGLSQYNVWEDLYDVDQLRRNEVPVYGVVFIDDMYVRYELSMDTARLIKGCKTLVTNQLYHDAIRGKTDEVLKALFAIRDDEID